MEDNAKKIIEVIADELNMDESEITLESTFTDDLGADSLDVCQIIMRLEDMYKITIDDDAAMDIKTVGDAVAQLEKVVNA
ncbi:MAG: acyl carrier protein [Lachnospiraceae bacterium]|nr:acyl carrier protein [Lachnospiraceae bacterium]MEE1015578.1 acyl carrier protein [Lachnospiraceae bacterium]